MKDMKKLSVEELKKVSGGVEFPGFPGVRPGFAPEPKNDDEPKDGGATYTW